MLTNFGGWLKMYLAKNTWIVRSASHFQLEKWLHDERQSMASSRGFSTVQHLHAYALPDADALELLLGNLAFSLSFFDFLVCLCGLSAPLQLVSLLAWSSVSCSVRDHCWVHKDAERTLLADSRSNKLL